MWQPSVTSFLLSVRLVLTRRAKSPQNSSFLFTQPSGKRPAENIWKKGEGPQKNSWKVFRRTFCLSRSEAHRSDFPLPARQRLDCGSGRTFLSKSNRVQERSNRARPVPHSQYVFFLCLNPNTDWHSLQFVPHNSCLSGDNLFTASTRVWRSGVVM